MSFPHRSLALFVLLAAATAHAGTHDFSLLGLGKPASNSADDSVVRNYRALAAELAMVVAPRALTPAETLGVSGFEFAFVLTYTGISSNAAYWQGQANTPVFEGVVNGGSTPHGFWSPTLQVRKGLPFSTDIGVQVAYLAQSNMVTLGLDLKVALFESYLPKYLPDLALRGAVGHLVGADTLTQTTLEVDVLASYTLPIAHQFTVSPVLGVGQIFARTSSGEMDATPNVTNDSADTAASIYRLPTLGFGSNHFTRLFFGARLVYGVASVGYFLDLGYIPGDIGAHTASVSHSLKIGFDV